MRNTGQVETDIATFAREVQWRGGCDSWSFRREQSSSNYVACRGHNLPAIYPFRYFVNHGGLICYGPNYADQYRRAGAYIARVLQGQKPADLPVQAPVKYDLAINLKTAKALNLTVTPTLLARADEVIE